MANKIDVWASAFKTKDYANTSATNLQSLMLIAYKLILVH